MSGKTHGMSSTRLYNIWHSMKIRCNNKNHRNYEWYGAKEVKVCEEWLEFTPFMKWSQENGYNDNLTLDRMDSNGMYAPENCRWISRESNASRAAIGRSRPDIRKLNRERATLYTYGGATKSLKEWAQITGKTYGKIYNRLDRGYSIGEALGFEKRC